MTSPRFPAVGSNGKLQERHLPTRLGNLAPSPLTDVQIRPFGETEPRPVRVIDGRVLGSYGTQLAWSDDECETWQTITTAAPTDTTMDVQETSDGEILLLTPTQIFKSAGWGTPQVSFTLKATTNGLARFQDWSLSGDGTKWITTEYAAGSGYPDSRYARMSLDAGDTWFVAYDSVEMHGQADADVTHLHGCAYDPEMDAFFISEGHGPKFGIYVSTDDGATWERNPSINSSPAHTMLAQHPQGLVMGSDSKTGGLFGAWRTSDPHNLTESRVWAWHTSTAGVNGFGLSGHYDDYTGLVFVGFRTEKPDTRPIIAAGSPTSGGLVWEWPNEFEPYSDIVPIPLHNGRLIAVAGINKDGSRHRYLVTGTIPRPGVDSPSVADSSALLGGKVDSADSIAIHGTASASGVRNIAVGWNASNTAGQDSIALGVQSVTLGSSAISIGSNSSASPTTVAVGPNAKTSSGGNQLAIGVNAATSAGGATALGANTTAGTTGTAVGYGAASDGNSVAFGASSSAAASSVAVGPNTKTSSGGGQTAIGAGAATSAGGGTAVGSNTSAGTYGTAVGNRAGASLAGTTAIGGSATATKPNSVALGYLVTTEENNAVAFGDRMVHMLPRPTVPPAPANGAVLYVREISGAMSLCCRIAGGAEIVIAPSS